MGLLEDLTMKGVMKFGNKEKLSPQILKHIGHVSYKLNLPHELALVHHVFHVSMLKKYLSDMITILLLDG